ncbi:alpha/beta-Hydrolases superfamily protein [Striga asiatica]|uniref:Alpha/beta-Hydrolases superfamily protein n=1 Tax=Striga asiatica TaxID=4170 RepID=A0A5A7PS20_STRAF|nr:alpha/beta-Hydrolases superfamily protein [Striga asiatica]
MAKPRPVTMSGQKPKPYQKLKPAISKNRGAPLSLPFSSRKKDPSLEEKIAEILKIEEERNSANIKNSGFGLKYPDFDCGPGVGSYPFLEEPVQFQFGDDYGKQLFLRVQRELLYASVDNVSALGGCMKKTTDDVYFLPTQKAMVESFLDHNLF